MHKHRAIKTALIITALMTHGAHGVENGEKNREERMATALLKMIVTGAQVAQLPQDAVPHEMVQAEPLSCSPDDLPLALFEAFARQNEEALAHSKQSGE